MHTERVANSKCKQYVTAKKPFVGSNLYGKSQGDAYVVFSYGDHWPLYIFRDGKWYENEEKVSASTHRHRSLACPTGDTVKLDCAGMRRVLYSS